MGVQEEEVYDTPWKRRQFETLFRNRSKSNNSNGANGKCVFGNDGEFFGHMVTTQVTNAYPTELQIIDFCTAGADDKVLVLLQDALSTMKDNYRDALTVSRRVRQAAYPGE